MRAAIIIKGSRDLARALEKLPKELMRSSERSVLSAGAKPVLRAAKAKVTADTGLLKRSLGITVKKPKGGANLSARVGSRTGFKGRKVGEKTIKRGANKGKRRDVIQDPSFYDHLVEFGTSKTRARPFIRPAVDSAQGEVIDAMAAGLDKHLTRTVARLKRKAGV